MKIETMKIEKSNNPVAVGALVVVLALIVGRILWMVFGHGGPMAAAATVSASAGAPSAPAPAVIKAVSAPAEVSGLEAGGDSSVAATITTRNPFSVAVHSSLAVSHLGVLPQLDGLPHLGAVPCAATDAGIMPPLTAMPPFPVRMISEAGAERRQTPHGLAALPSRLTLAHAAALLTLKLTATVGGTEPLAIVQTTGPEPVILHVGDSLDGMRVATIHDQDIVFASGNGFWTLPLQSAQSAADGAAAVTSLPPAPSPVVSVAPPEEKTDDPQ